MDLSKDNFVLGEDGRIGKLPRVQWLSNANELVKKLTEDASVKINSAMKINDYEVDLVADRTGTVMTVELRRLVLNTQFILREDRLVPNFATDANSIGMNAVWLLPPTMKLWFTIKAAKVEGDSRRAITLPMLYATSSTGDSEKLGFWKLPLSNQYGDGRLCLGEAGTSFRSKYITDVMAKAIELLDTATWNQDQRPNMDAAHRLFRFIPGTLACAPPTVDWYSHCTRVSHKQMSEAYSP